jgi:hypothetical protein
VGCPISSAFSAESVSRRASSMTCRGTWARVTIDQYRQWALHTF